MRSWAALLKREYLEHRGAFVWFPRGILVLLTVSGFAALIQKRVQPGFNVPPDASLKLFELGYVLAAWVWSVYLAIALFFYFGDAFAADSRNNSMLFWKSMPVSDLKMLGSKFLAGLLLFPGMIFLAVLLTGILHLLMTGLSGLGLPSGLDIARSYFNITGFLFVYLILSLLWYAPFLAWAGALSTIFGRWSLPLSFFIPAAFMLMEAIVFYGSGPRGGYIWSYLSWRVRFGLNLSDYDLVMKTSPFDASGAIDQLFARIHWPAMAEGLLFALVMLFLASEYRRRRAADSAASK
jgi:ABC-2 type transport system permease protein